MPQPPETSDFVENPLRIRCVEVVELVTHYLEGALNTQDEAAFETHLAGCESCVLFVSQIELTISFAAATQRTRPAAPLANLAELSSVIRRRKAHG